MQLIKTVPEIKVVNDYTGLLTAEIKHEIKSTTANMNYTGPKISKEEWRRVLSFFRWVNTTTHSEAQVRFFVNPQKGECCFWAFPQEARTGMSAKEIDSKEKDAKMGEFHSQGFVSFGTNHSHCGMSAFQSGTDESDEKNQHGLHITIGKVGDSRVDMHARFYLNGLCFNPDMSLFWDIGDDIKSLIPPGVRDSVARWQMCEYVETPFPDEWRGNIIEVKTTFFGGAAAGGKATQYDSGLGYRGWGETTYTKKDYAKTSMVEWRRKEEAAKEIIEAGSQWALDIDEVIKWMDMLSEMVAEEFLGICEEYDIKAADVLHELRFIKNNGGPRKLFEESLDKSKQPPAQDAKAAQQAADDGWADYVGQ